MNSNIKKPLNGNINMKKMMLLAVLFLIPMIIAETSLGTFPANTDVIARAGCSNSTYSNISYVSAPNGSTLFSGEFSMTKSGSNYQYTIKKGNLTSLGTYVYCYHCNMNGLDGNYCSDFTITPTGEDRINSLGIFIILVVLSMALLIMGVVIGNEYVGFIAGGLFIVSGVYSMINGIGNLSDTWTRSISFVIMGLGLIFEISAGYSAIEGSGLMSRFKEDD